MNISRKKTRAQNVQDNIDGAFEQFIIAQQNSIARLKEQCLDLAQSGNHNMHKILNEMGEKR